MAIGLKARKNKFNAKPKIINNYRFDSTREANRYQELQLMEKAKQINSLGIHPIFPVYWPRTDILICKVELDFAYFDKAGNYRVEDVKGMDTALSKLKRKLVEAAHGITVEIIK